MLAGDGAVPDHEVDRAVAQRLRLGDETLREAKRKQIRNTDQTTRHPRPRSKQQVR